MLPIFLISERCRAEEEVGFPSLGSCNLARGGRSKWYSRTRVANTHSDDQPLRMSEGNVSGIKEVDCVNPHTYVSCLFPGKTDHSTNTIIVKQPWNKWNESLNEVFARRGGHSSSIEAEFAYFGNCRSGNIHPWPGLDVEIRLRKDCETWVTQIKTTTTTIDKKRIGIAIKDFLTDLRIFIGELNKRGSHMIISIPPQSPGGGVGRRGRGREAKGLHTLAYAATADLSVLAADVVVWGYIDMMHRE
ncbi:uncharacterized protein LAJ45_04148 [Morchella importuna]|uniref:uncharacterized protein n=1 Tax=Morchella importuna TaxID=1174673 RepID=UPI001E8DF79D|nr:uncharacterized protein LAJ45_04148 [Morchella importuna]KAH8151527.1 hypothetical protein LAJ45_04148 [Morchella importuna]